MSRMKAKSALRDLQFKAAGCYAFASDVLGKRRDRFPPLVDRRGSVAVVTGGARGLGLHVVAFLLKCRFTVVVGVRNPGKAEKALQELENSSDAIVLPLDLDSFRSVERFAKSVLDRFDKIDVLVNNAGILLVPYALTEDGIERHFGVNYLGHFLLTHLLMPALAKAGEGERAARVVAVTSTTYLGGEIHFDDINLDGFRNPCEAYAQSKLALIMNSCRLAELARQRGWRVNFYTVDPGIVATEVFEGTPVEKYLAAAGRLLKTPEQGSRTILHACIHGDLESSSGEFLTNCGGGRRSVFSRSRDHQGRLFLLSCDMIGVDPERFGGGASDVSAVTHL